MNAIIHTYKEVYMDDIRLYSDGHCSPLNSYKYHIREVINKMACFVEDGDLLSQVYEETEDTSFAPGSSLFVASECKIGRDTYRNSGYSITRDRGKANAIVVPDIKNTYFHWVNCNIVAYDEAKDELHLVSMRKSGYANDSIELEDIARVRKYLAETLNMKPDCADVANLKVWFIPKCDDLAALMKGTGLSVPYCQESMVPIQASTQISPETLVFWENINDENLLTRTICQSDWCDYPVTLLVFLIAFKQNRNWYNFANQDFRRILNAIGYQAYRDLRYSITNNVVISPKDYAMLQSYLFYRYGVPETGGNMMAHKFSEVPDSLESLMRRTVLVKPMTIPVEMKLGDIRQLTGV